MEGFSSKGWDEDTSGNIGQQDEAATATILQVEEEPLGSEEDDEAESDTANLINKAKNPVWSFAFYQEFFDVDTNTVLTRIKGSLIPLPSSSFTRQYVQGKPDMYGPFWICATLVLALGICGNLSTVLNNLSNLNYVYKPQFELLPVAAAVIFCYVSLVPLFIKGFFWWRKSAFALALSQMICLYGYSLFIYIPSSLLFIVPYVWFNWLVVAIAASISGAVIALSLWPALRNESRQSALIFTVVVFALHATAMILLRLYFFSPIKSLVVIRTEPSALNASLASIAKER